MSDKKQTRFDRGSGILLHITSLPGKYGIGNLGKCAHDFVDYLKSGGQKYWQILPVGPVSSGYSYSPYSSYSSFAGNEHLIDPASLQSEDWMKTDILAHLTEKENVPVIDYTSIESEIKLILKFAFNDFMQNRSEQDRISFESFCSEQSYWLDSFSLFKALADKFGSLDWKSWDEELRNRNTEALNRYISLMAREILLIKFTQYLFDRQWRKFKKYCLEKNILLIGDIPIYAGMDSADVWMNPDIFQFSEDLTPTGVSGVPPDYFSATGQKWGTPLYKWFENNSNNIYTYDWWHNRLKRLFNLVDIVRIDHFRAFESYWSIDPDSSDGRIGRWERGPGEDFFNFLKKKMETLPVIAEDLGIITREVTELREKTGFPGMKILQFAFDQQPENPYLPENITDPNCVIYTGTHDNNTSVGWFFNDITDHQTRNYIKSYLKIKNEEEFLWQFISIAISSSADISIIPLQDLLGLPAEFRLNTPGTSSELNWRWKSVPDSLNNERMLRLRHLCEMAGRKN